MKKIIGYFGIAIAMLSFTLLTGCVKEEATPAKAEAVDSAIVVKSGYYEDKNIGFSLNYLPDVFTVENDLEGDGVVLFREHEQKVPSIVLRVNDKTKGVALDKAGEEFLEKLKADNSDSDRFKITETSMVKLKSGVDANLSIVKWRYQGAIVLYSAVATAYKNNKVIYSYVTCVPGPIPIENLKKMAMGLNITP